MINIPLEALPNQSFSIQLDEINYDITINSCGFVTENPENFTNIMAFTIYINNVLTVAGSRAVAGFPIIPSQYLANGNFVVVTANEEYPNYLRFGIDQYLIYASPQEIIEIQNGTFVVPG